ncbi:MAG: S-adenosylmethionine synthetase N-terminal domain-containing protein [Cellulosilyticaceae bacterium]
MFEKVNPSHPDKIADRIAGAIVDKAYTMDANPKIAVEVLIGHGECSIIIESNITFEKCDIDAIVNRISDVRVITRLTQVQQDPHLAHNQNEKLRCGDNGIFKGVRTSNEEIELTRLVAAIYRNLPHDGKYIIHNDGKITACQSCLEGKDDIIKSIIHNSKIKVINPLGN